MNTSTPVTYSWNRLHIDGSDRMQKGKTTSLAAALAKAGAGDCGEVSRPHPKDRTALVTIARTQGTSRTLIAQHEATEEERLTIQG